ncbi:MAG: hypothetical protein Q9163_000406 [Psora crenata]
MATYGKRKKGLLSSFSVFRDEEQNGRAGEERLTFSRPGKTGNSVQRPRSLLRDDDESIDELAGDTLLKDVPQRPKRATSYHDELTLRKSSRQVSGKTTNVMAEDLDKPLPPIPSMSETASQDHKARPALTAKTTNARVRKDRDTQPSRPKISPPTLQPTISSAIAVDSRPATSHSVKSVPILHSTTTDPADFERKISHLMQQAATQEAESKRRTALFAEVSAKPSPLQRGKKAFVKATRALKGRLSNGNSSEKVAGEKVAVVSPPGSRGGGQQASKINVSNKNCKGRLDRRMAEGVNLSNPKIQSLTGDGNVPRKPLPVYESMRSRVQRSSSLEDPFSDDSSTKGVLNPQNYCGLDFNFDKHRHKSKAAGMDEPVTANDHKDGSAGPTEEHSMAAQPKPRFSNMISGLRQHPDTTYFSSSPIAQSTPSDRLIPKPTDTKKKRISLLTRSPSILEFSFEGPSDDEHSVAFSTASKTITEGSQSVKRKSGQENLRSPTGLSDKKARVSSRVSRDERAKLAAGLSILHTEDDRRALSQRDKYSRNFPGPRQGSIGKGLAIFDVGKGKARESQDSEAPTKRQHSKGVVRTPSSFSRPSSIIFRRDSKAGGNRSFAKLDDDMDVDELA